MYYRLQENIFNISKNIDSTTINSEISNYLKSKVKGFKKIGQLPITCFYINFFHKHSAVFLFTLISNILSDLRAKKLNLKETLHSNLITKKNIFKTKQLIIIWRYSLSFRAQKRKKPRREKRSLLPRGRHKDTFIAEWKFKVRKSKYEKVKFYYLPKSNLKRVISFCVANIMNF